MTPLPLWPVTALSLAAALWWQSNQRERLQADLDAIRASAIATQIMKTKIEEQSHAAIQAIDIETQRQLAYERSVSAAANHAAVGLRRDLAAIRANARRAQSASVTPECKAGSATTLVLSDLLGESDKIAGELAAALDEARVRGMACEASYSAVSAQGNH